MECYLFCAWIVLAFSVDNVHLYSNGVRLKEQGSICLDQKPHHYTAQGRLVESRSFLESPYTIIVNATEFNKDTIVNISISGRVPFRGFLIQVRTVIENPKDKLPPPTGEIISALDGVGFRCDSQSVNTVAHSSGSEKMSTWVLWKPPTSQEIIKPLSATVTVVESYARVWIGLQSTLMKDISALNEGKNSHGGLQIVDTPIVSSNDKTKQTNDSPTTSKEEKKSTNPLLSLFGGNSGGGGFSNIFLQMMRMRGGFGMNPLLQLLTGLGSSEKSTGETKEGTDSSTQDSSSSNIGNLLQALTRFPGGNRPFFAPANPFAINPFSPFRRSPFIQPFRMPTPVQPRQTGGSQVSNILTRLLGGGGQSTSSSGNSGSSSSSSLPASLLK